MDIKPTRRATAAKSAAPVEPENAVEAEQAAPAPAEAEISQTGTDQAGTDQSGVPESAAEPATEAKADTAAPDAGADNAPAENSQDQDSGSVRWLRMTTSLCGPRMSLSRGDTRAFSDLPGPDGGPSEAQRLIDAGFGVECDPPKA